MFDASNEALERRMDELAAFDTVSSFSLAYCRRMLWHIESMEPEATCRVACAGLLEVELRYHRELHRLTESDSVSFEDVRAAGEKHRIGLQSIEDFSSRTAVGDSPNAAVLQLLAAECAYHLRRTSQVVTSLERANELGIDDPLFHLALGYHRYMLAVETCTEAGENDDEAIVRDPLSFQVQCLRAVGALENGLTGGPLDAQLYWWIGTVLDAAGLTDAAQDAYDKSAVLFRDAPGGAQEAEAGTFEAELAITEEEVRLAGELLKRSFAPSEILGVDPDEGS